MNSVNPYLNLPGNAEEAFNFYKSVFGGEFVLLVRFGDFGEDAMGASPAERDKIAHISLPLGKGNILMGTDALEAHGKALNVGNNFYISLEAESLEEAESLFSALSSGGKVEMPLQKTEWAEGYGMCTDKFGVQWMLSYTGSVDFSLGTAG
jgi:PhnB protein